MADRIAITSTGIISALGSGNDANIDALTNKRSGLNYPVHLQTKHSKDYQLGEIDLSDDQLAAGLNLPTGNNGYTRTTLIALHAMQELMSDIDIDWLILIDSARTLSWIMNHCAMAVSATVAGSY